LWDNDKNKLKPNQVFKCSGKKFWFKCDSCPHSFESRISNITSLNRWCPYCAIPLKKLCNDSNCTICFEKSFASFKDITIKGNKKVELWDYDKNEIKPNQVSKGSDKKCWFKCDSCYHSFESSLDKISGLNSRWCPYCSNKKLCDDNNCSICFEKTFASYKGVTIKGTKKVELWDNDKNKLKPNQVFKCSQKKYWFNCDSCPYSFESSLSKVSGLNRWCPLCKNKTEQIFFKWLKDNIPYKIKHQPYYDWCRKECTNNKLPFDFSIEELKLILEVDGRQHFTQVSNWDSPEEQHINDKYKMTKANENGYSIIRILQEDIYNDKNEWNIKVKTLIKKYIEPINHFVGDARYNKLQFTL
jgi:very-short-patch-repair endonuclease